MGFLDNSGDIILDVVLTDEGRRRLANGDYKIVKFALGDDEINYALYDPTATTYNADLQILQTPVLEAFTNNISSMNSKLATYSNNDLLHLTVFKLNETQDANKSHALGTFVVAVDGNTENNNDAPSPPTAIGFTTGDALRQGVIFGQSRNNGKSIRIDTGLATNQISPASLSQYPQALKETQFLIQMDDRLGFLVSADGKTEANKDYTDGDGYAVYTVSSNDLNFVMPNSDTSVNAGSQVIQGPRGPTLQFSIASKPSLQQNTYLFNLLGSTGTMQGGSPTGGRSVHFIDSIIKVTGINTGYSIDVPVRYVKLQ